MSKRNAVSYIKQDEPSFLKQFKEKVGYVEGPDVDTKRQARPPGDGDSDEERPDGEDEQPQIVVLKKGDLTAEEFEEINKDEESEGVAFEIGASVDEEEGPKDGKIVFKKPVKRSSEEMSELQTSSFKKKKEETTKEKNLSKATKNASLLSFGDDDEEEDSDE